LRFTRRLQHRARDVFKASLTGRLYLLWTGAYSVVPSTAAGFLFDWLFGALGGVVAGGYVMIAASSVFLVFSIELRKKDGITRERVQDASSQLAVSRIQSTVDALTYDKVTACYVLHAGREIRTLDARADGRPVLGDVLLFHLAGCEPADISRCEAHGATAAGAVQIVPRVAFQAHETYQVPVLFTPELKAGCVLQYKVLVDAKDRFESIRDGKSMQLDLQTDRPSRELGIVVTVPKRWRQAPSLELVQGVAGETVVEDSAIEDLDSDTMAYRWKVAGDIPFRPQCRRLSVKLAKP